MEVTLDDFSNDKWDVMNIPINERQSLNAYYNMALYQYISGNTSSVILCGRNNDGSAGAPEGRDSCHENSGNSKPAPKWEGEYGVSLNRSKDGRNTVTGTLKGNKGDFNAYSEVEVDPKGNLSGKVGLGGKF
jgi:hypothetical protein